MAKKEFKIYQCEEINSIVELAERSKRLYGDCVAYIYKEKKQRVEKTYNDLVADSKKFAQFLMRQNLKKGHVAVIGGSSYQFIVSYYAAMYAGLVIVPLDKERGFDEISELHASLEKYYINAMDFSKNIEILSKIKKEIFG